MKLLKGTICQLAIQCNCPDTGETGNFLFRGLSHREPGSRVSPIFEDLADLYAWAKTRFDQISGGGNLAFIADETHEPRLKV